MLDGFLGSLTGVQVVEAPFLRREHALYDRERNVIICGDVNHLYIRLIAAQERRIGLDFVRAYAAKVRREMGLDDTSA